MVHQFLETRTERDQLNSECHKRICTKTKKMTGYSYFANELTMVKKISSAKDLELDEMQIRVKAFEGELMCAWISSYMQCYFIA